MSGPVNNNSQRTGKQLEEEDELLVLPQVDNSAIIARYKLSLVGRMFHREGRTIDAIIALLPNEKIWNVAGRVRGIALGNWRFQFDFDSERDLQKVLRRRPCHVSGWSFALERWEPHIGDVFPNTMTFWIYTEGIPSQFWMEEIFDTLGRSLGEVRAIDAPLARLQVTIRADEPLRFRKKTQLPTGEVIWVALRCDKLLRWCKICQRICHEEDLCPLNPETQAKVSKLVSGLTSTLGKQSQAFQSEQAKPPSGPPPNGKSTSHPSWWRPELAPSPPKPEKSHVDDYRRRKAEGKRVVGNSSSSVWERLEKRQTDPGEPSSKARYHDTRNRRDYSPNPPRHKARKEDHIGRSNGAYNRPHKPQGLPPKSLTNITQEINRKRRYEDSFDPKSRKPPPLNEKISGPPLRNKKSVRESSKPQLPPQASDSQATMSDPLVTSLRAKQTLQSPDHTRERPFRLNLKKRSENRSLGQQLKAGNQTLGDSSDTGSSAKKSLNFDVMESEEIVAETQQSLRFNQDQRISPLKKSWYEQTLEEEEANEDPEPVNVPHPSKSSHIRENIECTLENSDEAVRIPVTDEIDEEGDEEANQDDLNELEKDWMRKKAEQGCVNLNWTEEDEAALQEDEISEFISGDLMEEDDLLGDEIEDLPSEKQASSKKKELCGVPSGSTKRLGMGRTTTKEKKSEVSKKALSPKAQSGQAKGHTAASKRLQNMNKRFSPKRLISNSASARPRSKKPKPAAKGPGNSVFPSSSKDKTYPPFDSTGGSKKPPGTAK